MGETYSESKPWESISMAVPKKLVDRENERLKYHGVKCAHYDPHSGKLIATSKKSANAAMRIRGMQNLDAGYGDYAGA